MYSVLTSLLAAIRGPDLLYGFSLLHHRSRPDCTRTKFYLLPTLNGETGFTTVVLNLCWE